MLFDKFEVEYCLDVLVWVEFGVELCCVVKFVMLFKYLVFYFVVVDEEGIFLVDYKNVGLWLLVGGYVELGEYFCDMVICELFEEFGLEVVYLIGLLLMIMVI